MGMDGKVGMDVQEAAAGGLVDPAAFEAFVLLQVPDPRERAEPFKEGGRIELVDRGLDRLREQIDLIQPAFIFVVVFVVDPPIRFIQPVEFGDTLFQHFRIEEVLQHDMRVGSCRLVFLTQLRKLRSSICCNRKPGSRLSRWIKCKNTAFLPILMRVSLRVGSIPPRFQGESDGRPDVRPAPDMDRLPVGLHDMLANGQPQTGTAPYPGSGRRRCDRTARISACRCSSSMPIPSSLISIRTFFSSIL